jgi:prenyltransferase beta subunit
LIIIISLIFTNILVVTTFALAKPRKTYITDFIIECQIEDENGFANSIEEEKLISYESTAYALEILDQIEYTELNSTKIETKLTDDLIEMFDSNLVKVYDLYFILKSLNILNFTLNISLSNNIYNFLNGTKQDTGGFAISNTSSSVSLASTYYAIQSYTHF